MEAYPKIGDTVVLNSGGPKMIVECDLDAFRVWCTWSTWGSPDSGVYGAEFYRHALRSPNAPMPPFKILDDEDDDGDEWKRGTVER